MSDLDDVHIDADRLQRLIALAREEDLGQFGDRTTAVAARPAGAGDCSAQLVARSTGVICGLRIAPRVLDAYASDLKWRGAAVADGDAVTTGTTLATLHGSQADVLACERVLLNFLQRLSGVASLTHQFVARVEGTPAKIYDTRKTTPGLRDLEKYAVRCGGGHNHRRGLHDAILVKDNHLAGVPTSRLAHHAFEILNEVADLRPAPDFIEFEVDSLDQLEQLLKVVGINIILLDNFSLQDQGRAVELRDRYGLKDKLELEASGNVTLDSVRACAETGVDRIAVGALTHSATALDIALEIKA